MTQVIRIQDVVILADQKTNRLLSFETFGEESERNAKRFLRLLKENASTKFIETLRNQLSKEVLPQ